MVDVQLEEEEEEEGKEEGRNHRVKGSIAAWTRDKSASIMSKVQGGMKCVKYLVFFFNLLFWLSGLAVLSVGLWIRFDSSTKEMLANDDAPGSFFVGAYILLGVGGLMMVVGFFGCFGAIRESQCLLGSFFFCLIVIFGAEIAVGVFGFINKDMIVEEVQKFYSASASSTNANETAIALIFHKTLGCCGDLALESTSCAGEEQPKDCISAIANFFETRLQLIGYIGIGVAAVMVIGMIFSMVLCYAIKNNTEVI